MIRLQNLTGISIRFQGATIKPYGFADFQSIYDYTALARLETSGKARYFTVKTKAPNTNPVHKDEKSVSTDNKDISENIVDTPKEEVSETLDDTNVSIDSTETSGKSNDETSDLFDGIENIEVKEPVKKGRKRKLDTNK